MRKRPNGAPTVEEMEDVAGEGNGRDARVGHIVLEYKPAPPPIAHHMRRATIEVLHSDSRLPANFSTI